MKTRQIHQPPKQRYRYIPDLCRPFEAHIGRRLSKWERAIIYAFEHNRKHGTHAGRFIIVDNDPAIDSRQLLIDYFLWRSSHTCQRHVPTFQHNVSSPKHSGTLRQRAP